MAEPKRSWFAEALQAEEQADGTFGEGIGLKEKMEILEGLDETGVEISEIPKPKAPETAEKKVSLSSTTENSKRSFDLNHKNRKTLDEPAPIDFEGDEN